MNRRRGDKSGMDRRVGMIVGGTIVGRMEAGDRRDRRRDGRGIVGRNRDKSGKDGSGIDREGGGCRSRMWDAEKREGRMWYEQKREGRM